MSLTCSQRSMYDRLIKIIVSLDYPVTWPLQLRGEALQKECVIPPLRLPLLLIRPEP